MFANLSQNSILYILEVKDKPKLSTGTVNTVSLPLPRPQYATFGQMMETVVDITATVDGEKREFKRVPSNTSIANFGPESFILADSKEAMNSHISTALQNSKNIVESVNKHKQLITDYEELLEELNPNLKADREKDRAIQTLQDQVSELKQMLIMMTNKQTPKNSEL